MGDRCYWNAEVKRKDLDSFVEILFGEEDGENSYADDQGQEEWVELSDEQANYGYSEEMQEAASKGCVFYGHHGSGDCYGPMRFVSDGKQYVEVASDYYGNLLVQVDDDGNVVQEQLEEIRLFIKIFNNL